MFEAALKGYLTNVKRITNLKDTIGKIFGKDLDISVIGPISTEMGKIAVAWRCQDVAQYNAVIEP